MNAAVSYLERQRARTAPTADITLPSGEVFTIRRPPLKQWIQSGRMPDAFLGKAIATKGQSEDEVARLGEIAVNELSPKDVIKLRNFMNDAICYACVNPRLYRDDLDDVPPDALRVGDLDEEDYQFLLKEIRDNCPSVPVALAGGGVASVESLESFRAQQRG